MKKKKHYPWRYLQTEYDDGFECCKKGLKRTANPNIKAHNSFAYYSWDRGWVAASILYSTKQDLLKGD
jgi:hypothetical protein